MPNLRVGLHLALNDGAPASPAHSIPNLLDTNGQLRADMVRAGIDIFLRPAVRRQMRLEVAAQIAAFRKTGLTLDHINSHHHFHLHPSIGAEVVRVARENGVAGVRVPSEPRDTIRRLDAQRQLPSDPLIRPWCALLRSRVRKQGLATTERVFGLAWSGAMTASRLLSLLRELPGGATEIYLHPATSGAFPEAAAGYRYADELQALTDPQVIEALRATGARAGGYRELP
jgi:hopanoid biosynthesis associated protein HpnK